jgi:hypothetical protein
MAKEKDQYQIVLHEHNVYYRAAPIDGLWTHTVKNRIVTDAYLIEDLDKKATKKYGQPAQVEPTQDPNKIPLSDFNVTEKKTLDLTPLWQGILPGLLLIIEDKGMHKNVKEEARIELRRMAQAADKWNAHVKDIERSQSQEP